MNILNAMNEALFALDTLREEVRILRGQEHAPYYHSAENLRQAIAEIENETPVPEVDLNVCPNCGGPADNGFRRGFPSSPYFCTKCTR